MSVAHLEAERVSTHLAEAVPAVEAICLFGSVARGDERQGSDIDLLVLGSDPTLTVSRLRLALPERLSSGHLSVAYHTPDTLARHLTRWSRFGVHLKREGKILFDRHGLLKEVLDSESAVSTYEELRLQMLRLRSFDHLERFGGRFLFPLAHLYSIGRTVTFVLLAERDLFEFNQEHAFERLAGLTPERSTDIEEIARLRPFAELTTGQDAVALPFDFLHSASTHVAGTREAIRRLAGLSQHADDLTNISSAI